MVAAAAAAAAAAAVAAAIDETEGKKREGISRNEIVNKRK